MGNLGVLLLCLLQLRDSLIGLPSPEQRQSVVHPLAHRVGIQLQRHLKLLDGLLLRGGIFVKRLAQIAMYGELLLNVLRRLLRLRPEESRRNHHHRHARRRPPHFVMTPFPSSIVLMRFTGTETFSCRPLGQRTSRESTLSEPNPKWRTVEL